jgi:hypothetical protein
MSLPDLTTADVTIPRGEKAQSRRATEARIAELIGRFKAEPVRDTWRVLDRETRQHLPDCYSDSAMAEAGARVASSIAIRKLFDPA